MAILSNMYHLLSGHTPWSSNVHGEKTTAEDDIESPADSSGFKTNGPEGLVPVSYSEEIPGKTAVETVGKLYPKCSLVQSEIHQTRNTSYETQRADCHARSSLATPSTLFGRPVEIPVGALQLGSHFATQGKNYVKEEFQGFFAFYWSRLRWYYDVDDRSVMKKLLLLCVPYFHRVWSSRRSDGRELPLRLNVNAPDLYIPVNAFVTLVLTSCFLMGHSDPTNFSPALLGDQVAFYLTWLALEFSAVYTAVRVMNICTDLAFIQILCLLCYKYVGMSVSLTAAMALGRAAYHSVLTCTGVALWWYTCKTLSARMPMLGNEISGAAYRQRRWKMIAGVSVLQPLLMFLLNFTVVPSQI